MSVYFETDTVTKNILNSVEKAKTSCENHNKLIDNSVLTISARQLSARLLLLASFPDQGRHSACSLTPRV